MPRHRGGAHTWENLVAACKNCNHRKGGKTLDEARLRLLAPAVRAAQRRLLAVHAVPRGPAQRGLAGLPLPRPRLTAARRAGLDRVDGGVALRPTLAVLDRLWAAGHAAYVVGGGRCATPCSAGPSVDWDLATDARPGRSGELFPGGRTRPLRHVVTGALEAADVRGHDLPPRPRLRDHRRPDRVTWTDDLPRTWPGATSPSTPWPGVAPPATGSAGARPLVGPHRGWADLDARLLRAVGDPDARFSRGCPAAAARASGSRRPWTSSIEPATLGRHPRGRAAAAPRLGRSGRGGAAAAARRAPRPSVALRLLDEPVLLAVLVAGAGRAARHRPGEDAGRRPVGPQLRTVDAAAARRPGDRSGCSWRPCCTTSASPTPCADGHFHRPRRRRRPDASWSAAAALREPGLPGARSSQ